MHKARPQANVPEIVSLMFVVGRFMKDKMHKRVKNGQCNSMLEFETLRYVKEHEHPYMRDVAKNFHVTPPAATLLVDSLVKEKLLERSMDARDRRSVKIGLTKKGREVLDRGMATRVKELKRIIQSLTPAERNQFTTILKKIIKNNT